MHDSDADVIVLGAGPGGEVVAGRLGEEGLDVLLVEPHLVGGECAYYGCMPSKALLRPLEAIEELRRIPGARELLTGAHPDPRIVLDRRDEVVRDLDDAIQLPWIEDRDVRLHRGPGRLVGERLVELLDGDGRAVERVRARRAVIVATGTAAALPPVDGLAAASPWTNRDATTADRVPDRLVVLGGGPIGAELAQAWAGLGSTVTLLEAGPRLLAKEEPFAAELVTESLRAAGVDVRVGVAVASVARDDDGPVTATLEGGEAITGDELLVAAGRQANTGALGLDSVGVTPGDHGYLATDAALRVGGRDWLYAVGDVNGRALLTHQAKRQARIVADRVLGRRSAALDPDEPDGLHSPRVTFTEPQVAAVGHTLASARDAGIAADAIDVPTDGNAGASFVGKGAGGTTRFVVDRDAGVLAGVTFTGAGVAEQLHAATIAVTARVPLEVLDRCVPAFPTRTEVWLPLIDRDR
ncbi:MAG: NAD(P)/FAD-dependent oxidoreductase [Solirubrobacteraceae bacterium]|nr:NAD(P)/FAD-dependent oxidoreductase [Solirubrobacteraceae bacterium]